MCEPGKNETWQGRTVCTTSGVVFSSGFVKAKQSQAERVDKRKTLPGGRAATMFFFSSKPSDAVLAVKHSCTQSDNNVLSAVAARNGCKTEVLDSVWQSGWAIWPGYSNNSITSFHGHVFVANIYLILC